MFNIMSSANRDSLLSFLSDFCIFIYLFIFIIALAGTFNTRLNSTAYHVLDAEGTLMGPIK